MIILCRQLEQDRLSRRLHKNRITKKTKSQDSGEIIDTDNNNFQIYQPTTRMENNYNNSDLEQASPEEEWMFYQVV